MESVIKFLNENTDYNFHSQLDISIKTCVSDPQNSVFKSYRVLEQLIEELYFGYVADKFLMIDPTKKEPEPNSELIEEVKTETPLEITKKSAQAFLDLAKEQGKVKEK